MPDQIDHNTQEKSANPLRKLVTGQYGLAATYWLWGIVPGVVVNNVIEFVDMEVAWLIAISVPEFMYFTLVGIGVFAAARKYNGHALWAILARAVVVLGMIRFMVVFGCLVAFSLLSLDTEESAATDVAQQYEKNGVRFRYPGNWRVDEDAETPDLRYIIIKSPGDALAIVQFYPNRELTSIEEFARNFAASAKTETHPVTITDSEFGAAEQVGGYLGVTERFGVSLGGESIPHVRLYRYIRINNTACFIICQMAVEDQSRVAAGFEQLLASFAYENP